jgi:hypothetical protein
VNIKRALLISVATVVASTGLLAPLKNEGLTRPIANDLVGFMLGAALAGATVLLLLVVPALISLRWFLTGRVALRRQGWAVLGGLVVVIFMVALNGAATAMSDVSSIELAASWWSLTLGGAVCGWFLFSNMPLQAG